MQAIARSCALALGRSESDIETVLGRLSIHWIGEARQVRGFARGAAWFLVFRRRRDLRAAAGSRVLMVLAGHVRRMRDGCLWWFSTPRVSANGALRSSRFSTSRVFLVKRSWCADHHPPLPRTLARFPSSPSQWASLSADQKRRVGLPIGLELELDSHCAALRTGTSAAPAATSDESSPTAVTLALATATATATTTTSATTSASSATSATATATATTSASSATTATATTESAVPNTAGASAFDCAVLRMHYEAASLEVLSFQLGSCAVELLSGDTLATLAARLALCLGLSAECAVAVCDAAGHALAPSELLVRGAHPGAALAFEQ